MFQVYLRRWRTYNTIKGIQRFISTQSSFPSFVSSKPVSNGEFRRLMDACGISATSKEKIVVGVSGGPDSMALLHLMKGWTDASRLVAVTIDHGFREESAREAAQVHDWVTSMNIEHITKRIDWSFLPTKTPSQNQMEKLGRDQRYHLMNNVCQLYNTNNVIVAHHGDDQIETFLMRLYRGSGFSGLACMKRIQVMDDGTKRIRPLLEVSKSRLLATCQESSIPYVIDPSNHDLQYDRNRIRHGIELIRERNEMDISNLLSVVNYFQDIRYAVENEIAWQLQECCQYNKELGICRLNATLLSSMTSFTIESIIKSVCCGIGGSSSPSEKAIKRVVQVIQKEKGMKKPMQVAGCILSELKPGSSVYAKKRKSDTWICVCLDRNQLPQRSIDTHAVELAINSQICYINQYNVKAVQKQQDQKSLITVLPLPFLPSLPMKSRLFVSFMSDPMLQGILCSNRGILTRRNLSDIIARSIPAVFADINGKREIVYSPVLKVNRIKDVQFSMHSVPKAIFKNSQPWVIY